MEQNKIETKKRERKLKILRDFLENKSGLIVHSSSCLLRNNNVFIFAGNANVGKTTIVKKISESVQIINDDMNQLEFKGDSVIVSSFFKQEENQNGRYFINENLNGKLKAVFFPVKEYEKKTRAQRLFDDGLIWKKLLQCCAPPIKGEERLFPAYFETIEKLIRSVDFFNICHNLSDSASFVYYVLKESVR